MQTYTDPTLITSLCAHSHALIWHGSFHLGRSDAAESAVVASTLPCERIQGLVAVPGGASPSGQVVAAEAWHGGHCQWKIAGPNISSEHRRGQFLHPGCGEQLHAARQGPAPGWLGSQLPSASLSHSLQHHLYNTIRGKCTWICGCLLSILFEITAFASSCQHSRILYVLMSEHVYAHQWVFTLPSHGLNPTLLSFFLIWGTSLNDWCRFSLVIVGLGWTSSNLESPPALNLCSGLRVKLNEIYSVFPSFTLLMAFGCSAWILLFLFDS